MEKSYQLRCDSAIRKALAEASDLDDEAIVKKLVLKEREAIAESLLRDYLIARIRSERRRPKNESQHTLFGDMAIKIEVRRVPKILTVDGKPRHTAELSSKQLLLGRKNWVTERSLKMSPDAKEVDKPIALRHLDRVLELATKHHTTAAEALRIEIARVTDQKVAPASR